MIPVNMRLRQRLPRWPVSKLSAALRWTYHFNGLDNRGQLMNRAINADLDIRIKFRTGPTVPPAGQNYVIISQMTSSTFANREFLLQTNTSNALQILVGGIFSSNSGTPIAPNSMYEVSLIGNIFTVICNGVTQISVTFNRGAAREPSAVTAVASRISNGASTWGFFYLGPLFDIEINGTLWPMDDQNQVIQLPRPSGLGAELITQSVLENPAVKSPAWSYLGNGRWQLVGDGNYQSLRFLDGLGDVVGLMCEFEIESITGTLRLNPTAAGYWNGSNLASAPGKYRCWSNSVVANNVEFVRHNTGQIVNCIIKNISFRALGTCNPMILVNTTSPGWQETET